MKHMTKYNDTDDEDDIRKVGMGSGVLGMTDQLFFLHRKISIFKGLYKAGCHC